MSSATAQLSCGDVRGHPWHGDFMGLGSPTLSHLTLAAVSSRAGKKVIELSFWVQDEQTLHPAPFPCLTCMDKREGKVGTHPDRNNCSAVIVNDCFKSCAQFVFPSPATPLRLISAKFFVNLVAGRKFVRDSQ